MSKKTKTRSRKAGRERDTQENNKTQKNAGGEQTVPEKEDLVWISPEEIAAEKTGPAGRPEQPETETAAEEAPQRGRWLRTAGEVLYNCPYLLALCLTGAVAFFCSDEIGIRAIAADAEEAVSLVTGSGAAAGGAVTGGAPAHTDKAGAAIAAADASSESAAMGAAGQESTGAEETKTGGNGTDSTPDQTENTDENARQESENAGERKSENNNKENEINYNNDNDAIEIAENKENTETGVTKYEFYDPITTDSPYYSDAGKVALTTTYPYTKENESYFNDAAFLGDSRTLGISDYAGLDGADFYCDSGMMIFKLLEEDGVTYQRTGEKVNLAQVLQEKHYGKIYIMLGMNELGYGNTPMYLDKYREVVEQIRAWQPGAVIYIMANLHVSEAKNNMETEFNNININDKNAAAASLANGKDIFYLDANPLFTDENGFLNAELTFDGVHLYAQHYDVWREFLMEHAVETKAGQTGDSEDGRTEAE